MTYAVLGFGSNIEPRLECLNRALGAIGSLCRTELVRTSSVYETEPVGCDSPDRYLNMCALVRTDLSVHALLGACLGIEAALGRERPYKNAPRTVDIDLLLYGDETIDTPELTVPHPRMWERGFVTVPLLELDAQELFRTDFGKKIVPDGHEVSLFTGSDRSGEKFLPDA
ncbi:MAG: 2-amino-4-hydroxy-6-hydroxymethyldihydropteridine diphosphokinase [Clostridia bacterium]|nr:2-amino-4-hydroxy-6-hydroxymethyldihydropteridine diphosphokinase [Clostridia bacterium]